MKRFFKFLAYSILFLYILLNVLLYFFQEKFVFNPYHLEESYKFQIGTEVEIPLEEGLTMNAVWQQYDAPKGAILYLHGNRGSNHFGTYQARHMLNRGYDVLIPDYRGYGKTEGEPESEELLYQDIEKAYQFLTQRYNEENIIVVGYSLGTGMASYIASKYHPKHLVLVAPYTSLTDIKNKYLWFVPDFILKYHFSNYKNLKKSTCPVSIVHGTADELIAFDHAEKLAAIEPTRIFKGHKP